MKNKPGIVTNFVPHQNGSKIPHITFQTREINYSKFYKKKKSITLVKSRITCTFID